MNKKILTPLFVLASFLLIGCSADKIVARPNWINEDIVDGDFKNNKMKEIYDAIKELGDTNANVLNKVMYDIAQNQLGHFEDYTDAEGVKHLGLKTIASASSTDKQVLDFVNEYPIYKSEDKAYKLTDLEKHTVKEIDISKSDHDKATISRNKVKRQYTRIKENIYESLFNDIKGGEYSSKNDKLFQEEYFVQHLYKEMYFAGPMPDSSKFVKNRVFIPKQINDDEDAWEKYVNATETVEGKPGFLQVSAHWGDELPPADNWYGEYINRKILPEIYRTLLIENYVREQRYTNLGRSYARKITMITVPRNSDKNINIKIENMLNHFADITAGGTDWSKYNNFKNIETALNGFAVDADVKELLTTGGFESLKLQTKVEPAEVELTWQLRTDEYGLSTKTGGNTLIYKGTKLYDLVEKYLKVMEYRYDTTAQKFIFSPKSHLTSDELTAYNDLTNNGTISVERGLVLKEREIRLNSMVKDGWFLKSGGLTDLYEDFRNDLFNIKTAKILDDYKKIVIDEPDFDDTVRYFGDKTQDEDGQYPNRKAFLYDDKQTDFPARSIILDDKKTNYYIVEVEEAGSASKFSQESAQGSYLELKATTELGASNDAYDEIVRKVTKEVASGETYKKNAEQYYLMISNIIFYDQSVYDYFKSQFPELFK